MNFTSITVPGADAVRILMEHRARYPATGRYPFLIGESHELERIQNVFQDGTPYRDRIIQASLTTSPAGWMAERRVEFEEEQDPDEEDDLSPEVLLGEWPGDVGEKGEISVQKELFQGEIKPELYLGLVDIQEPWQLPAMLDYGDCNYCPEPAIHCACLRSWQERFGAEIVSVSAEVIECVVAQPPRTREAAIELAWEQYLYCPDIVYAGCETISNLAALLLDAPYWFFWWD